MSLNNSKTVVVAYGTSRTEGKDLWNEGEEGMMKNLNKKRRKDDRLSRKDKPTEKERKRKKESENK